MIDVEETDRGLRAVDVAKNEVEVDLGDWHWGEAGPEIDRRVHETCVVVTDSIELPGPGAFVESESDRSWNALTECEVKELEKESHLVQIDGRMTVLIRFDGRATIKTGVMGDVSIQAPHASTIRIGFRSHVSLPNEEIVIPGTPEGLAAALTVMGRSHLTEDPTRSYPSMRMHPPLVRIDDSAEVPRPPDGEGGSVIIESPDDLRSLYILSPLAFYLGAEVTVHSNSTPRITLDSTRQKLSSGEGLETDVSSLLRRIFYMDCIVRNVGPYGFDIEEMKLLADWSLDLDTVYDMAISERVSVYLDYPFQTISSQLPTWPLAIHLDPVPRNLPLVPHVLNDLAIVFSANPSPVGEADLIEQSLSDFSRSISGSNRAVERSSLVRPSTDTARVNGWLSEGTPLGGYKLLPSAIENRLSYLDHSNDRQSISIVLNDEHMRPELDDLEDAYSNYSQNFGASISIHSDPSRTELADLLRREVDFFHYIGHCDPDGLRCTDGRLSVGDVSKVGVRTFLLNACDSYEQGLNLLRKGSVAGVVTIGDVIDAQARIVGRRFTRLLLGGFNVTHALRIARSRAILNRQFLIVGDGMHKLTRKYGAGHFVLHLNQVDEGSYRLRCDSLSSDDPGIAIRPFTDSVATLSGSGRPHSITPDRLKEVLHVIDDPIIFEDDLYWPDELLGELF